jgi:DNA-binding SARP family transcriptional activator
MSANITINITMFGAFKIEAGGSLILEADARTHQLWHLIEYLVAFRHRDISQAELIQALWHDGSIDNPGNALKNLVYRMRTMLEKRGLPLARDMIVFSSGRYRWNNELPTFVDSERFEELYGQLESPELSTDTRLAKLLEMVSLYADDFLPGAKHEAWVAPLSSRFRAAYFKCVAAALEILSERRRYQEAERIAKAALQIDPFDETCHRYYIMAMVKQGRQNQALLHYSYMTDLFFREMGVRPSASTRELYRDIVRTVGELRADIGEIKEELNEGDSGLSGAFFCEYEVFKNLYRLEARTASRTGQAVFISLLTLVEPADEPLDHKQRAKIMDSLFEVIKTSLRRGDVFSKFSATQYVLMLPTLTYENCEMVMERVIRRYKQTYRAKAAEIVASVQPLSPVELQERAVR